MRGSHKLKRQNIPFARQLRVTATDAEARLWLHLRNRMLGGFKFRRQFPVGPYIADFVCIDRKLIVELDGGQHADNPADERRTRFLELRGYRVIRFWNPDVLSNTDGVLEMILLELQKAPHPSRRREAVVGRVRGSGKENPHRLSLPSSASILSIGPSKLSGGTA